MPSDASRQGFRRGQGARSDAPAHRGKPSHSRTSDRRAKTPRSSVSPARRAALEVGREVRLRKAYTQEIIAAHIDSSTLNPADRAFATRLALGVTSCCGTLDEVIDRCLRSPEDVQPDVRDALRISAYEIIFLDKSPHAAVDQGVELVRTIAPRAAGLANAALRKVVATRASFPFGNPQSDHAALARLHAFPLWLCERLIADLGRDAAERLMKASNEPAPIFIAVNTLRSSDTEVEEVFRRAHFDLIPTSVPGCYRVSDSHALLHGGVARLLREGCILVSDAAAQAIAYGLLDAGVPRADPEASPGAPSGAVSLAPPRTVLEIGAGRGTKTILFQSYANRLYGHPLELTAIDNHAFKIDLLKKRAAQYAAPLQAAYALDATQLTPEDFKGLREAIAATPAASPGEITAPNASRFDLVFIDAPCSGLGTLRRHPEIRWKLLPEDVSSLARTSQALLTSAAPFVAAGGGLAFATCTVLKEENEELVARFLASEAGKDFELLPFSEHFSSSQRFATQLRPGSSDAHFAVRMQRKS